MASPAKGTVHAVADLDGDGSADVTFEVDVECTAGTCSTAPLREKK